MRGRESLIATHTHTILTTCTVSLTEQLKRDLHEAMHTFNVELTAILRMAELIKTRSDLTGLKKRWRTLSPLLDSERCWIETVGVVSVCVCV